MNNSLVLLLVGLSYIGIFGGLALLRREGLSIRFAVEGLAIVAVFVVLSLAGVLSIHAILLLVILYLVTMRVRLLTDLARMVRNHVSPTRLLAVYDLALRLGPDACARVIVQVDRGATLLRAGRPEEAVPALEEALACRPTRFFNPRYEASCRYNLGRSLQRLGDVGGAAAQFNQVIDMLPGTIYAQLAEKAMAARAKEGHQDRAAQAEEEEPPPHP